MLAVSTLEALGRPTHLVHHIHAYTLLALATPSLLCLAYALSVILGSTVALQARYLIPLLGMLLGNATTSVSIAYSTLLESFRTRRDAIEFQLAMGANRNEVLLPHVRHAFDIALRPLLNMLSLIGLVSIPGMMAGQLLAGQDPFQASLYQLLIMMMVLACSCLAVAIARRFASTKCVNADCILVLDQVLYVRQRTGLQDRLEHMFEVGLSGLHHLWHRPRSLASLPYYASFRRA